MNTVALLIGGNQGDRGCLIQQATEQIRLRIGSVVASSHIYETEPWGDFGDTRPQNFLNQALVVETPMTAHEVLSEALAIEASLGRRRPLCSSTVASPRTYYSRPIDIDLIFYNEDVVDTPELVLPHPRMHLRRFVLEPLAEIVPDYHHPTLHKKIRELLDELPTLENE